MSAPTPPPKRPDRHYDFTRLNVWFTWGSVALLAITGYMVWKDYDRPWKHFQREFRELDRQRVSGEMEAARQRISADEMAAAQARVTEEEQRLAGQRDQIAELEDQIADLDARIFELDAEARKTKSFLDTAKYLVEAAVGESQEHGDAHGEAEADPAVAAAEKRRDELAAQWEVNRRALQEVETARAAVAADRDEARAGLLEAEKAVEVVRADLTSLQRQLETLEDSIAFRLRNAPLLEAAAPDLKIEQVILPGLFHDINFARVDRVDRCMTCHVPINRAGFEGDAWPNPYRSHPRLDLFVGDSSPHPYGEFGCTVCHGGLDRATDFARAGHTPPDETVKARWVAERSWERQQFLETPMLPVSLSESGCLTCHASEVWIPGSSVQDVGRQLISKMGCYGCHVIDLPAFSDMRRPGPDLRRLAGKVTPEWTYRWIEEPRAFHPTTFMPHFFGQENIVGEENQAKQQAELRSIVEYLFAQSQRPAYPAPPTGDAERGRQIFESVGCTGCHLLDADAKRQDFFGEINRLHGPNLIRTGSKVDPGWLYAWVQDPRQYFPDTNMPDLRLTPAEAADVTAYLMTSRDPAYETLTLPPTDEDALRSLVTGYLQSQLTIEQSEARYAEMEEGERLTYLGEQSIRKYGCFGCHEITGFEDAKPIGVELSEEGSKPLHLFDFGHVHEVDHSRQGWIRAKLLSPRSWDRGKEQSKSYDELYKMPNFGMSPQEADAVLSNVLAFTKESVLAHRKAGRGERQAALAEGRKLVTRYNCQGCHLVEGKGQAIRSAVQDVGLLPPNLASEGARVQADWLFHFLRNPGEVSLRPWLSVRMPTFGFSEEQTNVIVEYFAALDDRNLFLEPPAVATARDRAVGEVVFGMLQCARCHPAGKEALANVGGAGGDLAPSLLLASHRLRHDWVPDWIIDPQKMVPGTKMPAFFPQQADGTYRSDVAMGIEAPMFSVQRSRLLPLFDDEDEMRAYLADPQRVAAALTGHIWSLSRGAGAAGAAP